jgi:hypothetical protein
VKAGATNINRRVLKGSSAYVNNAVIIEAQPVIPYTFLLPYYVVPFCHFKSVEKVI